MRFYVHVFFFAFFRSSHFIFGGRVVPALWCAVCVCVLSGIVHIRVPQISTRNIIPTHIRPQSPHRIRLRNTMCTARRQMATEADRGGGENGTAGGMD